MGGEPWVVLSSPAAVHEAFVVKGSDFSGRPMVPSMHISSGGGQGFARPTLMGPPKGMPSGSTAEVALPHGPRAPRSTPQNGDARCLAGRYEQRERQMWLPTASVILSRRPALGHQWGGESAARPRGAGR